MGKKTPSPDSGIIVQDFEPRDFVTGKVLTDIYSRKHKLFFVFTNDSTPEKAPVPHREWMQAIDDSLDEKVGSPYKPVEVFKRWQFIIGY